MDETVAPSPPWLTGWKLFWLSLVGILVAVVIGIACWFNFDSDLRAIEARAKAMGVPTDWKEFPVPRSPPSQIAAWKKVESLSKSLPSWRRGSTTAPREFELGVPLPPDLLAHHAAIDPEKLTDLLAAIDEAATQPLRLDATYSFRSRLTDFVASKRLLTLLGERIASAPTEQLPEEIRRAFRANDYLVQPVFTIGTLVRVANTRKLVADIAYRLHDLKSAGIDLTEILAASEQRLIADAANCRFGEFLACLDLGRQPRSLSLASGSSGLASTWMTWMIRVGREPVLTYHLDSITAHRDNREITRAAVALTALGVNIEKKPLYDPRYVLARLLLPAHEMVATKQQEAILALRLLAAESSSQPWPTDSFDPVGKPLRRIERGGQLIGAYSFGNDCKDDGGDAKKDVVFALYGKMDSTPSRP